MTCDTCNDSRVVIFQRTGTLPVKIPCPKCSQGSVGTIVEPTVRVTFWVVHHKDRGKDPRPYVWTRPPDEAQRASIEKDGYLVFRVEATLPGVEDVGIYTPNTATSEPV